MIIVNGLRKSGNYLFQDTDFIDHDKFLALGDDNHITIPLAIDTEYKQFHYIDRESQGIINCRLPITLQIKGIHCNDDGQIFVYPEYANYCNDHNLTIRHPIIKNGFVLVDYLESQGYKCELTRNPDYDELKTLPVCEFVIYAHFAIAELYLLSLYDTDDMECESNVFRIDIDYYVKKKRIQFGKRTYCVHRIKNYSKDSIFTAWTIKIENKTYRIKLAIFDTAALHGNKSYKVLAANTGVKLESKDLMKNRIENMHIAYNEVASDYDAYSLGDLKTYEMLKANAMNFESVYDSLGISDYYKPPKLSIGATVANVFRAKIGQLFNVTGKALNETIETYCRNGTAQYLLTKRSLTSCLLAKADGGRCRNNRPLDTYIKGALCDLDISGCYGEGQRSQLYPFGNPLIMEFPSESKINDFPTLRKFLESVKYGQSDCELIYGLWFARVCTKSKLEFEQDYISSWFDITYSAMENEENADIDIDENVADILDTKTGKNKILLNEIENGVIQSDTLDWIFNVCGQKQRNELLDKVIIKSAVIYPASEQCFSIPELVEKTQTEKGLNTCILKYKKNDGRTCKIMTENESYAWYGVNLGEFLIDDLMARRKTYPKKNNDGSVNSFNELYKLLVNTLYGDLVSPYFDIGNTTVGNNITARARAMAYYIEKGLYGFQTITDGGSFDLNNVVYPRNEDKRKVSANDYCGMYRDKKQSNYRLAPLGGYDKIDLIYPANLAPVLCLYKDNNVTCLQGKKAQQWIDKTTFEHLKMLFPNVTVLHGESTTMKVNNNDYNNRDYIPRIGIYEFEMKDFYTTGVFHSSANYRLKSPVSDILKMRSYEKKKHDTVEYLDGELKMLDVYNDKTPAQYFMNELTNPNKVNRGFVFTKDTILKIGEYVQRQNHFEKTVLVPGDSYWKQGLLREFSLSQFTFRTMEQYKEWDKMIMKMKDKYGQSIEMFFINKDKTLDYQAMIEWIDDIIDKDISPVKAINSLSKAYKEHPRFADLINVKNDLIRRADISDLVNANYDDD